MDTTWHVVLTCIGIGLAAINAGAFFAFTNFVMPAFRRLDEPEAIRAMQQINLLAPNPLFVAAIVGAGPVGIPVVIARWEHLGEANHTFLLAAIVMSLGSFLVTVVFNIPRNNALAAVDAGTTDADTVWSDYLVTWTRANTVRGVVSMVSVVLYALALR